MEVGLIGYLFPLNAEAALGWMIVVVVGGIWLVGVKHGIDQISDISPIWHGGPDSRARGASAISTPIWATITLPV